MKEILFVCCNYRCADREWRNIARQVHGRPGVTVTTHEIKDEQTCILFQTSDFPHGGQKFLNKGWRFDEIKTCGNFRARLEPAIERSLLK